MALTIIHCVADTELLADSNSLPCRAQITSLCPQILPGLTHPMGLKWNHWHVLLCSLDPGALPSFEKPSLSLKLSPGPLPSSLSDSDLCASPQKPLSFISPCKQSLAVHWNKALLPRICPIIHFTDVSRKEK